MGAPCSPGVPFHIRSILEDDIKQDVAYMTAYGPGKIEQFEPGGMVQIDLIADKSVRWLPLSAIIRAPDLNY